VGPSVGFGGVPVGVRERAALVAAVVGSGIGCEDVPVGVRERAAVVAAAMGSGIGCGDVPVGVRVGVGTADVGERASVGPAGVGGRARAGVGPGRAREEPWSVCALGRVAAGVLVPASCAVVLEYAVGDGALARETDVEVGVRTRALEDIAGPPESAGGRGANGSRGVGGARRGVLGCGGAVRGEITHAVHDTSA